MQHNSAAPQSTASPSPHSWTNTSPEPFQQKPKGHIDDTPVWTNRWQSWIYLLFWSCMFQTELKFKHGERADSMSSSFNMAEMNAGSSVKLWSTQVGFTIFSATSGGKLTTFRYSFWERLNYSPLSCLLCAKHRAPACLSHKDTGPWSSAPGREVSSGRVCQKRRYAALLHHGFPHAIPLRGRTMTVRVPL